VETEEAQLQIYRYLIAFALTALLALPAAAQTATQTAPGGRAPAAAATSSPAHTASGTQQRTELLDLNSASREELDKLPGIGVARSQAIIANRPYKGKDELVQRKIVPQGVYDQIKDKIIARQSPSTATGSGSGSPASKSNTSR
jgi:competence protein ComEA